MPIGTKETEYPALKGANPWQYITCKSKSSADDKYKQIKPKHQEVYFEAQRREITLFQAAQKYFAPIMKGKTNLPLKEWKDERVKLTSEKKSLYHEYHSLKDEVREIEIIRRNVEDILREESRETQRKRAQDMEM